MKNRTKLDIAQLYGLDDATVAARAATAGDHAMTTKAEKFLEEVRTQVGSPRTYRHSSGQGEIIWESIWLFVEATKGFRHKTCTGGLTGEFEEVTYEEAVNIVARDFGVIHGLLTG